MKKFIFISLLIIKCTANAQTITTFAGGGGGSFTNGMPATDASLQNPLNIVFDKSGNCYFAGTLGHIIYKIDSIGRIFIIGGNGSLGFSGDNGLATLAQLNQPAIVAIDTGGNFVFSDQMNNRIRKIDKLTGIITTIAGTGFTTFTADGTQATATNLHAPAGITCDKHNNIYYYDAFARLRKINNAGIVSTISGDGTFGFIGDNGPASAAELHGVVGLLFDKIGNLYLSDEGNYRVRKIDTNEIITTIAGDGISTYSGDNIPATNAQFWIGAPVVIDRQRKMYIADDEPSYRVRVVDTFGIIHTYAGCGLGGYTGDYGAATAAKLGNIGGLGIDTCGNIYISDVDHSLIRKVTPALPTITTTTGIGDTVCAGNAVTLHTAINSMSPGTPTYQWYINGTLTAATSSSYTYTPANGDSIRCVLTYSSPCSGTTVASSNTIYMVVDSYSVPSISVTAPVYATIGSIVTVNATVAGAGSSYNIHWYNRGVLFATTSVPMVSYTKVWGIDTITARVVSTSMGCYDSTLSSQHLVTDSTTEVGNYAVTNHSLTINPNPAGRSINVGYSGVINNIMVSNLLGSVLIRLACSKSIEEVNIASLPSGVYFVKVNGVEWGRFVKE